jgi:hypothetical protein
LFTSGNANYSANSTTVWNNINKANPQFNLYLNGTANSNIWTEGGKAINITATTNADTRTLFEFNLTVNATNFIQKSVNTTTISNNTYSVSCSASEEDYNVTAFMPSNQNYTLNTTTFNIRCDKTAPTMTGISPQTSSVVYESTTQVHWFNITVTDSKSGVSSVILTFDGINYTATKEGSVYYKTLTGIGTGSYAFKWYANDSVDPNWASSADFTYSIVTSSGMQQSRGGGGASAQVIVSQEFVENITETATGTTEWIGCGNGVCSGDENFLNCPKDCPTQDLWAIKIMAGIIGLGVASTVFTIEKPKNKKVRK